MAGIVIKGLDELIEDINRIEKEMPDVSKKMMNTIGQMTKDKIKMITPVDSGELRSKNFFKTTSPTSVLVYNTAPYAAHVEYGHRTRLGTGKKSSRLFIKGRRTKAFIEGQFFMKRGINEAEKEIPKIVRYVIGKVFKK